MGRHDVKINHQIKSNFDSWIENKKIKLISSNFIEKRSIEDDKDFQNDRLL